MGSVVCRGSDGGQYCSARAQELTVQMQSVCLYASLACAGLVFTAPVLEECQPSVTLHHYNTTTRLTETAGDTTENIPRAERVVVEGWGECFMLYESRDKEGKSYFATTDGEHSLTLEQVAVMERVPCGEEENMESKSILATIILTVLVILLIVLPVSIASILFFCVFE